MSRPVGAIVLGLALASCHRDSSSTAPDAGVASAAADADSALPRPTVLAARCHPTSGGGGGFALDDGRGMDDLEIGDAVAGAFGFAVDVVHRTAAGRVAAVALLPAGAASMQLHDLGPTLGDAPPPRVASRGADLVAVSYVLSKREGARELGVHVMSAAGEFKPTGTVLESRDDSLAFDVSPTLVVWDEARMAPVPRGVIRVAEIAADGHPGAARDISPPESDAEMPRVTTIAGMTLVFWLDRKPESAPAVDASATSEVTGEARANSWLEVIAVDPHGAALGAARRLTALTGHVSAYDVTVAAPPGVGSRPEVLVAARDDGEAVDGSGGALLRVRVREGGQDPPLAFANDGLGRGAPEFVDGSPPSLSWVSATEQGRLLSLDSTGAPTQLPSAEPALDDARPLVWIEQGRRLLAATPGDSSAQLQVLSCVP
jgi:hypothetical protein